MLLIQKLQTERQMIQFCDSLDPDCQVIPDAKQSFVDSDIQPQNPMYDDDQSPNTPQVYVEEMRGSGAKQSPASATIANFGYGQAQKRVPAH